MTKIVCFSVFLLFLGCIGSGSFKDFEWRSFEFAEAGFGVDLPCVLENKFTSFQEIAERFRNSFENIGKRTN